MTAPSAEAAAALARSTTKLEEARSTIATHETYVFEPLRAALERNHIADKIKALFAT